MTEVKDIDRLSMGQIFEALDVGLLTASYGHQVFAAHREAAEKAERDRIVAWLRDDATFSDESAIGLAGAIERGEYIHFP